MSSDDPHSSQSQLYPFESALSSSPPSTQSYCYPSAIIESLQTGSNTRDVAPTIPGSSQFGHPARGQAEGSFERNPGPPESSLPLGTPSPGQGLANPSSDFSQTRGDPRMREYDMSSYPIMGQGTYMAGQIPQNPNVWPNRSPRPPTTMDQSMQQSHLLSSGYMGYNPQGNPSQGYYQRHSGQYFSAAQHEQLRSPPTQYGFSNSSIPGTPSLPDQPFVPSTTSTSQNYMLNHPEYYLPETSSVPSMPVSPQPPSQTIYSSPDSASATTDLDHPHSRSHSHATPPHHSQHQHQHQVRVVDRRPRPQCWDHGCNGREFSTFSNLLRHQREKSGAVAKAECPVCGAVFTRSTARNIHVAQGKCKGPAGGDGGY